MTHVLLLHGLGNDRPRGHWQRWLAGELRRRRTPVQYPQLPDRDAPTLPAWRDVAVRELEMLAETSGERVLMTHSLSCVLWAHLARDLPAALVPERVALIAPPSPLRLREHVPSFPVADARDLGITDTRLVARERDPYREEPFEATAARWGVPWIGLPGEGHLNHEDGHGAWPSALAWVITGSDRAWRLAPG
ncbi:alpha/beta hydrolase [Demequina sp. NBRC 110052]|uniref:RBBP9/YdeN family alpha/beta hydrolase n=1 Tax=Demequina sp. NBRC 110052 TaxID=1570341 RepID=UPI0009FD9390|nr:alpha/beta hydrolase [Demequina sp. NBRC 110052]